MTSDSTFPERFSKIDELTLPDHSYLTADDACYFLGEYTARKGYAVSATNDLVLNLKKPVSVCGQSQWKYKEAAIARVAAVLRKALGVEKLSATCFVPMPPSKAKGDPLHDDRLLRVLRGIRQDPPLDVRELIVQTVSTAAVHEQVQRPRPEEIEAVYTVDQTLAKPEPHTILLFDDLLTTGAHFKAAQVVLRRVFSSTRIVGIFVARRVPDTVDTEDFIARELL